MKITAASRSGVVRKLKIATAKKAITALRLPTSSESAKSTKPEIAGIKKVEKGNRPVKSITTTATALNIPQSEITFELLI